MRACPAAPGDDGEVSTTPVGGWADEEQVAWYLDRIGRLEARQAGERVLAEVLPAAPRRVLDLGCGDGRLAALVLAHRTAVEEVVCVDRSPAMLARARANFAGDARVEVVVGDLEVPLAVPGTFDVIVSGFAIHHLTDERKQQLLAEAVDLLAPGGVFANLEVVASATPERHAEFLVAIGRDADDPEDRLAPIEAQLGWMRAAGLTNVDCLWRWRGFALLVGER
jgi:SAM-dependent methyltransferase